MIMKIEWFMSLHSCLKKHIKSDRDYVSVYAMIFSFHEFSNKSKSDNEIFFFLIFCIDSDKTRMNFFLFQTWCLLKI